MSHAYYQNPRSGVLDFVKDAVISDTKAVALRSFQFFCPGRAWMIDQNADEGCKPGLDVLRKFSELTGCPGSEFKTAGHESDS